MMGNYTKSLFKKILVTVFAMVFIAVWDLLWAFPIKWAWNYAMPYIFGLPEITWGIAFCLLFVLASLWKITVATVDVSK